MAPSDRGIIDARTIMAGQLYTGHVIMVTEIRHGLIQRGQISAKEQTWLSTLACNGHTEIAMAP
jgi:hypothetical protein